MWGKRDEGLTNYSDPSLRSHVFFTAELWVNYARYDVHRTFFFFSFLLLLERKRENKKNGRDKKKEKAIGLWRVEEVRVEIFRT